MKINHIIYACFHILYFIWSGRGAREAPAEPFSFHGQPNSKGARLDRVGEIGEGASLSVSVWGKFRLILYYIHTNTFLAYLLFAFGWLAWLPRGGVGFRFRFRFLTVSRMCVYSLQRRRKIFYAYTMYCTTA